MTPGDPQTDTPSDPRARPAALIFRDRATLVAHARRMPSATTCALCGRLTYPVARGSRWTLALNVNQSLLGKVMIVANRHVEDVAALDSDEWTSLHAEVQRVERALARVFEPDLYNLAFLMNMDKHVHMHVVPRYRSAREWHGESCTDPHFGSLFGTEQRRPPERWMRDLVVALQRSLDTAAPG